MTEMTELTLPSPAYVAGVMPDIEYRRRAQEEGFIWSPGIGGGDARRKLVTLYSWAIPNEEALLAIAKYSPRGVVEIGSGTGYWSYLLRALGLSVMAYDLHPPRTNRHNNFFHRSYLGHIGRLWTEVKRGGANAAGRHPERTLMLCWPPYDTSMASRALSAYSKSGGDSLVYIGEGDGGCTADDAFHEALRSGWDEVEQVDIPQWTGIHDYLGVWKRKTGEGR